MAETLDEAIREAKIAAGLDPDEKHHAFEFYMHLGEWERPFWQRCLTMVFAEEGVELTEEDFT